MIQIFDANNVFRRDIENKMFSGMSQPRAAYIEAMTSIHTQIYVWDGYNHNARRRALFPGYKIRPPVAEDIFAGLGLLREILSHTKAIQIEVPEWEADDVIGVLAKRWSGAGEPVYIYTNDLDYYQLHGLPDITLVGINNNTGVIGRYIPLYKAMVGDSSDKIPGIPNFGPKAFMALEPYWDKIIEYLETNGWYDDIPFKPAHKAWVWENQDLLYAYWKIVNLWDVPIDLISEHTKAGVPNDAEAQALLRKYML